VVGLLPALAEPQDPVLGLTEIASSEANFCQAKVSEGFARLAMRRALMF